MNTSAWFLAVGLSGLACGGLSLAVIVIGWRRHVAEVVFLGLGLLVVSVMATSHGFSAIRFADAGRGDPLAALLELPLGMLAALPLLAPTSRAARTISRHWRPWAAGSIIVAVVSAVILVARTVTPPGAVQVALIVIGVLGAAQLVRRQLFLYRVSGQYTTLCAAAAVLAVSVSTVVVGEVAAGGTAAWIVLMVENLGVLVASVAIVVGYRTGRGVTDVLRPILSAEPLATLELGLSPEVHGFVAALEHRDPITRDHVVRTSALAMRVAIRAEMPPQQVRDVALGALLHDVGKLLVPSTILKKPGRLTDDEFRAIKTHPEKGERLLQDAPSLAGAVRFVRSHHERVDGTGYPDGLVGDQVQLDVSLVSVADAWDAMTHTRHYREALYVERAVETLREGAGTQWRADAVELVLAEVATYGLTPSDPVERVGRPAHPSTCPVPWEEICGVCEDVIGAAGFDSEVSIDR